MKKTAYLPLLILFLAAGCGREKKGLILAKVGSAEITAEEFARELSMVPPGNEYLRTPAGKKELLDLLVRRKLVLAEAEQSAVAKSSTTQAQIAQMEAEFQRQKKEAADRIIVGEFLRSMRDGALKVTDEEVNAFWNTEKEVKASHILVTDPALAAEIKMKIDKGESFEALAKKHSQDSTGKTGGDLGFVMKGSLDASFENALFALKIGEVTGPVTSPYGQHIIKKTGERPLSTRPLSELAAPIRGMLENQKFQAWLTAARTRNAVSVDEAALEKVGAPSLN